MQVSIIIAVYNRAKLLPDLLDQWRKIDKATKYQYELIFSDDESADNSVAILKDCKDLPIKVLSNEHGGASKARNHAYKHATGEIIIFTGDDIFPTLNFVNEHYEAYLKHGTMYASLGCIDWREGIQMNHLMKHITDIGCEQFGFVGMRPFEIVDFRHFYTSNISVAREQLEKLDCLFDPMFKKYGFEDIDLGYRLYKQGIQIIYNPNALAYHDHVYDSVEKFCKRQQSAGEELNTFKTLHPGLNADEIKFDIDEFHYEYRQYAESDKLFDIVGDTGRVLIYIMMQFTKLFEWILKKRQFHVLKKICSKFYSIIFSYYMYYGLAYGHNLNKPAKKSTAQRFTFRYLFFGKAQIFYDKSNHFSELNSVVFHTAGKKNVVLNVTIPSASVGRLRFDPLDHFCKVKIKKAVVHLKNGNQKEIKFGYANAPKTSGGVYDFSNQIDPVIISDSLPKSTLSVEIDYQINYLLYKRVLRTCYQALRFGKKSIKKVFSIIKEKKNQSVDAVAISSTEKKRKVWITIKGENDINLSSIVKEYQTAVSFFDDLHVDDQDCSSFEYEEYVYEISREQNKIEKSQFMNVALCLLECNYDFIIISDDLNYFPKVNAVSLQDSIFLSKHLTPVESFIKGQTASTGKFIRIPGSKRIANEIDLSMKFPSLSSLDQQTLFTQQSHELFWNNQLHVSTKEKIKPVVFVFPIFMAVGGVERNTIAIIEELKEQYDFVVITFESHRPEQGSLFYQIAKMDLDYYDFAEISSFDKYNDLLEQLKKAYQPDLLWMCNSSPWTMENSSELRKIFYNIPIVVQDVYDYEYGWIEYYDKPSIHSYDRFIAINKRIEEKFIHTYGIPVGDIDLVYSATDTKKIKELTTNNYSRIEVLQSMGLNPDKKYFAFIGRFTEQKQPLKLIELAKHIIESDGNIDFVMVGDGELSSKVDELIRHHKLEKRIHRIKYISNVSQFVKSIDGLFIASIYEGLPIVTIEAMCVGTPIFSTDVGDIAIFVNENNTGVISESHDMSILKKNVDKFLDNLQIYKQNSLEHTLENIDFFSSQRAALLMNQSFQKALEKYQG